MGILLAWTVVAQAYGAGDHDACRRWWWQGLWLGTGAAVPLSLLLWLQRSVLYRLGFNAEIVDVVHGNLDILWLTLLPLFVYAASRRYLQAIGGRPCGGSVANVFNADRHWALIYGHSLPALGTTRRLGEFVARIVIAVVRSRRCLHDVPHHTAHRCGWFGAAGRRRPRHPAAPGRASMLRWFSIRRLRVACLWRPPNPPTSPRTMCRLNCRARLQGAARTASRPRLVGHAVGRRTGAAHAGWAAIVLGVSAMSATALAFVLLPGLLIGFFTTDPDVIRTGRLLLGVGAVFAVFDGVQVIATGALRGLGETRRPMLWNLVGYWGLGLPIGWALAFVAGWGVVGIWIGLSTSLIVVGTALTWTWARAARDWRLHCGA